MRQVAEENRLDRRILYHRKVTSMSWDSAARVWALDVDVENGARRERVEASAAAACTGTTTHPNSSPSSLSLSLSPLPTTGELRDCLHRVLLV